ncbi:hypothetical protein SAMN05421690_100565 [Nitrosomonas sp. Nm51]|uniref:hypothetical protein n=1 Tax=Nitrosomonas sp. Nm51 TaxID=133720 RepID=UPI0008ACF67E|nr:hypothetical protein [Nitrosomonas sp. Nm51]SER00078.1 hypothetical protein SAMN05421690_100565 [Nitrosomonas sp. Nm51]
MIKTQCAYKAGSVRLLKCELKIKTRNGKKFVYHGLFKSTMAAITDATNRFEIATVIVRAV